MQEQPFHIDSLTTDKEYMTFESLKPSETYSTTTWMTLPTSAIGLEWTPAPFNHINGLLYRSRKVLRPFISQVESIYGWGLSLRASFPFFQIQSMGSLINRTSPLISYSTSLVCSMNLPSTFSLKLTLRFFLPDFFCCCVAL